MAFLFVVFRLLQDRQNGMTTRTTTTRTTHDELTHLLDEARRFPMLALEEEQALARAWRDRGDRAALERLIGSHLRLVIKVARRYAGYGMPIGDLVAEGHVGLMQAANRFEPERGFRFATYAMWWIRASIQEHVLHSWSMVKLGTTAAQKKLFFGLRKAKAAVEAEQGSFGPDDLRRLAADFDVAESEISSMDQRLGARDQSLNAVVQDDSETSWQDWLVDESQDQEGSVAEADELGKRRTMLSDGLTVLNPRERHILESRRLADDPLTLEDLAQVYGISRERVRQIEARAFEKLQAAVLAQDGAFHQAA
jgi:RNA polymerase sigma-32 factor